MEKDKKCLKRGFTLAELLIVVGIIAVLMAVAIPVFTAQLEKAKLATDHANLRSAFSIKRFADGSGEIEYRKNDGTMGVCKPTYESGYKNFYFGKDGYLYQKEDFMANPSSTSGAELDAFEDMLYVTQAEDDPCPIHDEIMLENNYLSGHPKDSFIRIFWLRDAKKWRIIFE